jgi:hypothetical protein
LRFWNPKGIFAAVDAAVKMPRVSLTQEKRWLDPPIRAERENEVLHHRNSAPPVSL